MTAPASHRAPTQQELAAHRDLVHAVLAEHGPLRFHELAAYVGGHQGPILRAVQDLRRQDRAEYIDTPGGRVWEARWPR